MSGKYPKKTTLMILIDAFSKIYFSEKYTPFLHDLSQDGFFAHIEPLFAFKGIETTIFTGLWPNIHNVWTEFCLANNQIGSRKDGLIRKTMEAVDLLPSDGPKAKLRYAIERYILRKPRKTPNLIPAAAMSHFQLSQPKEITEPEAVGDIRTIFDVFRKKGVPFVFIEPWIWGDSRVLSRARKLVEHHYKFRFWYLKFNSLDHLGHKYGPTPSAFEEKLNKMDRYTEEIVGLLQRKKPDLNVLVLADHGMSRVHKTVDILANLDQLRSKMYKDYIAFVDSTMIRLWFFTRKAKQEICECLQQIRGGHILTNSEKRLLKTPLDQKYGETIYVMDEGYVFHPCFFHSKSIVNGMHGYAYSKTPEALSTMIANGGIAESFQMCKQVKYTDIAQSILQSLLPVSAAILLGKGNNRTSNPACAGDD